MYHLYVPADVGLVARVSVICRYPSGRTYSFCMSSVYTTPGVRVPCLLYLLYIVLVVRFPFTFPVYKILVLRLPCQLYLYISCWSSVFPAYRDLYIPSWSYLFSVYLTCFTCKYRSGRTFHSTVLYQYIPCWSNVFLLYLPCMYGVACSYYSMTCQRYL